MRTMFSHIQRKARTSGDETGWNSGIIMELYPDAAAEVPEKGPDVSNSWSVFFLMRRC